MKQRILLTFLLIFPTQAIAQNTQWVKENYYLGSSFVRQDGTTLVAESHREGFDSVIHMMKGTKVLFEWQIPDLRVNMVRFAHRNNLEDQPILVAGSTGSRRSSRLYTIDRDGELTLQWDSLNLGTSYRDADVFFSMDGKIWYTSWFTDRTARIAVGTTEEYNDFWTWDLERTVQTNGIIPDLLLSGAEVLDSSLETLTMALVWSGSIMILTKDGDPKNLIPAAGHQVSGLYYHPETEILWATGEGLLSGFSQASRGSDTTFPRRADYKVDSKELGIGSLLGIYPRSDGRLALYTRGMQGDAIYSLDFQNMNSPQVQKLASVEKDSLLSGWGVLERASKETQGSGYLVRHLAALSPTP